MRIFNSALNVVNGIYAMESGGPIGGR